MSVIVLCVNGMNNVVEAHATLSSRFYEALMSIHVAKKESSSKTFRPRGSSSVTKNCFL